MTAKNEKKFNNITDIKKEYFPNLYNNSEFKNSHKGNVTTGIVDAIIDAVTKDLKKK